jgi:hypothetical protein
MAAPVVGDRGGERGPVGVQREHRGQQVAGQPLDPGDRLLVAGDAAVAGGHVVQHPRPQHRAERLAGPPARPGQVLLQHQTPVRAYVCQQQRRGDVAQHRVPLVLRQAAHRLVHQLQVRRQPVPPGQLRLDRRVTGVERLQRSRVRLRLVVDVQPGRVAQLGTHPLAQQDPRRAGQPGQRRLGGPAAADRLQSVEHGVPGERQRRAGGQLQRAEQVPDQALLGVPDGLVELLGVAVPERGQPASGGPIDDGGVVHDHAVDSSRWRRRSRLQRAAADEVTAARKVHPNGRC